MSDINGWSCKRVARTAGILSPLSGLPDGISISVLSSVLVRSDAASTAANILRSEMMFRFGMVAELCALAIFVTSLVLLYAVLKPAGRPVALLFLVLSVMGAAIQALDVVADSVALTFVKSGAGVAGLTAAQAQSMAFVALRMHSMVYGVALVFMGLGALCLAFLITRATFLPRVLGYFMVIDGLGFVARTFVAIMSPTLAAQLRPFIPFVTALVGEGPLWFWLMIKGVDVERWREQRAASN